MFGRSQEEKNKRLKRALYDCQPEDVKKLLRSGANPNYALPGATSLEEALNNNNQQNVLAMVSALVDAGVLINKAENKYSNACILHEAVRRGSNSEVMSVLLKAGAPLDTQDGQGNTPLMMALRSDNCSHTTVRWLLDHGGLTDTTNNDGMNAAMLACRHGAPFDIVQSLGAQVATVNPFDGNTPLHYALLNKDFPLVQRLLNSYPSLQVDHVNWKGQTPLFLAAESGNDAIAVTLLDRGALLRAGLLKMAVIHDMPETFSSLMRLPGVLADKAQLSECLLHAAGKEKVDMLTALMEAGGDINIIDSVGKTPLMMAVDSGNITAVRKLLEAGASTEVINADGHTAYAMAIRKDNRAIIDIMSNARSAAPAAVVTQGDKALTVDLGGGLSMTFNFVTQQLITRDARAPGAPPHVQNFADVQRRESIVEAYHTLLAQGGNPPPLETAALDKRRLIPATRLSVQSGG